MGYRVRKQTEEEERKLAIQGRHRKALAVRVTGFHVSFSALTATYWANKDEYRVVGSKLLLHMSVHVFLAVVT